MNKIIILSFIVFLAFGCKSKSGSGKDEVVVHLLSDPDKLLPYSSTSADASALERFLFQKLIDWDYDKNDFVGVLAVDRPKISPYKNGLVLEYEIRPEAKWDNGTDITGHDVAFTFKAVLNPKTSCEQLRPYFDFLDKIEIDSLNPKKFKIYSNQSYILVEEYSGYWVLPEYHYDPNKMMRKFSLEQMNTREKREALRSDKDMVAFADAFNSQKFMREKEGVVGSGPYEFSEWVTGSKLTFKKKKNWWGRNSSNEYIKNYAQVSTLKFKVINDWNTTTTAIKGGELDCIKSIEFKAFNELKNDERFLKNYEKHTPATDQYVYIGLNMSNPILKELKVRQALAHAIDKEQIIQTLLYGLGESMESMVHPTKKYYNKNLRKFQFDLELANKTLEDAGWKDSDGDGFRDKLINGKKTNLVLEYKYNSGNDTRKNIGLIFKENLKKIGVDLNIVAKEWTVFLDDLKAHNFEIYCGSWVGDPNVEDPKQIWHTESIKGGSNYVNYGDPQSDKMIDAIRSNLDEKSRDAQYIQFQEKVHNEIPYIFLYAPKERMAFHKRFTNARPYTVRPGYDLSLWKLAK